MPKIHTMKITIEDDLGNKREINYDEMRRVHIKDETPLYALLAPCCSCNTVVLESILFDDGMSLLCPDCLSGGNSSK